MADNEENGAGGAKGGWTEGEKYTFLLKIINQLNGEKAVKLSDIEMPGRTTKALSHQWAKIRSDAATTTAGGGEPATKVKKASTPRKKPAQKLDEDGNAVKATRKRKPKAVEADAEEE